MKKLSPGNTLTIQLYIVLLLVACSSAQDPAASNAAEATITPLDYPPAPAVTLPPAWTAGPTQPATATDLPTQTPLPGATSSPRERGIPPLVIVTGAPIDPDYSEWQQIQTGRAEFWIDDSFEVLEFGAEFTAIFEVFLDGFVESFSQGFGELSTELGATPPSEETELDIPPIPFAFFIAVEPEEAVSFILIQETVEDGTLLLTQLESNIANLEDGYQATEAQIIGDAVYPTGRFFVSFTDPGSDVQGRQLVYVILVDDTAWSFVFAAEEDTFGEWLPRFEKTVRSFSLLP